MFFSALRSSYRIASARRLLSPSSSLLHTERRLSVASRAKLLQPWTRPLSTSPNIGSKPDQEASSSQVKPAVEEEIEPPAPSSSSPASEAEVVVETETITATQLQFKAKMEPRLQITFTCTVPECFERSTHEFSRHSYEKGIVLISCPKCQSRHLIADNIGWFKEMEETEGGKLRTVEDLLKAKGEKVKRGRIDNSGVIEYFD